MSRTAHPALYPLLWLMLLLYLLARPLQLATDHLPVLHIVLLHVVPAAIFAFIHATITYGRRTAAAFFVICLATASTFETISLRTGFPFGHYSFTALMGPQWFHLPILLALAYVGMGYVSWAIALTILGYTDQAITGSRLLTVPLVATFMMVAWDLAMDPVWATLQRAWLWRDGGSWFGVPLSNYLGWFLTVFLFFFFFALYVQHRAVRHNSKPRILAHGLLPILFYAVSSLGNLLLMIPRGASIVTDPSGRPWRSTEILTACTLLSLFGMLPYALLAMIRLGAQRNSHS